jgi:hypothetical protein
MKLVFFFIALSISLFAQSQSGEKIIFEARLKNDSITSGGTPVVILNFKNESNQQIIIPKSFITSVNEQSVTNVRVEINYLDNEPEQTKIIDCRIDAKYEIDENGKMTLGKIILKPGEVHSQADIISCYSFRRIGDYKMQFTLVTEKTNLIGMSDWVTLKVIR